MLKVYPIKDKRVLLSLSPLSLLLTIGIPGLNIIVPAILWLKWKKDNSQIDQLGKKILNTQISYTIYVFVFYYLSTLEQLQSFIILAVMAWLIMEFYTLLNLLRLTMGNLDYRDPGSLTIFK